MIILIITSFGSIGFGSTKGSETSRSEFTIESVSEKFSDSIICDKERGTVLGLTLQIAGITVEHSISGIEFFTINEKKVVAFIKNEGYYSIENDTLKTLHLIFAANDFGYSTNLEPDITVEEMDKIVEKGLYSKTLTHIVLMKTQYKDKERIHSLEVYQIEC